MKYLIMSLVVLGSIVGCGRRCVESDEIVSVGGCSANGSCGVMTKNHVKTIVHFPVVGQKICLNYESN